MKSPLGFFLVPLIVLGGIFIGTADGQAHGLSEELHTDPELLFGWETWFHLSVQWLHLVAFGLWTGLTLGTILLGIRPHLHSVLFGVWTIILVLLATGVYNMEYSSGLPISSSLVRYFEWGKVPYGIPYSLVLNAKVALYIIVVLFTFLINALLLQTREEARQHFLSIIYHYGSSILMVFVSLLAAVLLYYHEAADLWPTPPHSMGGILGPKGVVGATAETPSQTMPNDFLLLANWTAWGDILVRWVHLLGFGLLLGGVAAALVFGGVRLRRFLYFLWSCLGLLLLSGVLNMKRWLPFAVPPYVWNLNTLAHIRFGRTYSLLLAVKHGLVLFVVALTLVETFRWLRLPHVNRVDVLVSQYFLWIFFLLVLGIAFIMMMLLLVHEGVDHAL